MSERKYMVIPFESAEKASGFYNEVHSSLSTWEAGSGMRLLDAEEYPTKRYNGWTNYETWAVNLWMSNDEGSYNYSQEIAQEAYDEASAGDSYASQTREESAMCKLADRIKDYYEDTAQDMLYAAGQYASVFSDLLNGALSEVNWYEIAEHLIEDVEKEAEEVSE